MCYFAKKAQDDKREVFEASKAFLTPGEVEMKERNREVMDSLLRMYKAKVKPLEGKYRYDFFSSALTDGDFDGRPMVLLLGQYSVGKTTFIRSLLDRDFTGIRIGPGVCWSDNG